MWHASVALFKNGSIVKTDRWGDGVWREARRIIRATLEGVGEGESVESVIRGFVHHRKSLTDGEISKLDAEWLAIPARDEFSEDGRMESRL